MGEFGFIEAVLQLIRLLEDKDGYVRWRAAVALGKMQIVEAEEKLISMLDDPDYNARHGAIFALETIGTPNAIAALEKRISERFQS